jgi:hypothetical protein
MVFDYFENMLEALMITDSIEVSPFIDFATSAFTQLKAIHTTICWLIVIVLLIIW